MTSGPVIAIDGPSASGKSSTAAAVARLLGMTHVDTGALYRALTWVAVRDALGDAGPIISAAEAAGVHLRPHGRELEVAAAESDADLQEAIRSPEVTARVSEIAAMPAVRDWVNRRLRVAVRATGGAVLDGRDIGTVVFPDAPLKVFLTASAAARAERRLRQRGFVPSPAELAAETVRLAERDRLDASREVAPLRQADDAHLLDTTEMTFEGGVDAIVAMARSLGLPR